MIISCIVVLGLVSSCSFGAESTSRTIPDRQRGSLNFASGPPLSLDGVARVYLPRIDIGSGDLLGSVPRVIDESDDAAFLLALVNDLIDGPSAEEIANGFGNALPLGTSVRSVTPSARKVTIDFAGPLALLNEEDLIVALSQIVYTMSEGFFIREVTIKIDGQNVELPRYDRTKTSGPLTIFDYPTAAITSQPAYPGIISSEAQI